MPNLFRQVRTTCEETVNTAEESEKALWEWP
ncbi:hypothetical protein BC739_008923 [Kutzneria viridogrisea]|uniref:Uncharacterized protein n=2 Tax=Kutzneria TaxID=43356 RepID=W5WLJ4_9PSEU|nr:hypothetical protein KALB_8351 [Kutzneria albida DSM 43870]MBA8931671.1 hypothetical protein [Kutzneria viridogrisea]